MVAERTQRRLAAILAADVVGYSRLMEQDEAGTVAVLRERRKGTLVPLVAEHQGRIVKLMGDGVLVEFTSAVNAVACAVELQKRMAAANDGVLEHQRIVLRIGINLGDVIVEGGDLYGEGVNIASRLEGIAEPGSILVSGTAYDYVKNKAGVGFDELGAQSLKNMGEPVRVYRVRPEGEVAIARPALALPDKPSIAVLPFENMSGDAMQEYFADGMVEDIITALSRFRNLFVIARNSSFTYKGRAVDVKQVGRELGVRYVLEGSVRKASNRLRITAQLIEAATGAHLWSERYDRDLADTFAVQDEITESVVSAIEPEMLLVERQRAARKNPDTMDAWDYYMRGMWLFYQFDPASQDRAAHLMRRVVELDPTYPQGHIGLARVLAAKVLWGWSDNPDTDRQAAFAAARRGVELDDKDPYTHYILAWSSLLMRKLDDALAEAQKAIDRTPNFALAYFAQGAARLFLGRFDQVADSIERAIRLSPHEPLAFYFANILALARYQQGRYDEAAKIAQTGLGLRPFHALYLTLAACYGQLGRLEEARAALAEMRRLQPNNAEHRWEIANPYLDPTHRSHFIDGLRKAGWAE
jgi:adenylate cyclase